MKVYIAIVNIIYRKKFYLLVENVLREYNAIA